MQCDKAGLLSADEAAAGTADRAAAEATGRIADGTTDGTTAEVFAEAPDAASDKCPDRKIASDGTDKGIFGRASRTIPVQPNRRGNDCGQHPH